MDASDFDIIAEKVTVTFIRVKRKVSKEEGITELMKSILDKTKKPPGVIDWDVESSRER